MSPRILLLLLAVAAAPAVAQPMADPGDETRATALALEPVEGEPGRWARIDVRLPAEGRRFWVGGLDVTAPLSIQVAAERLDAPVAVSLHRFAWGQADARGDTADGGIFRFDGRAQARVGIQLTPGDQRPARATLLVWQGPPQRADFLGVVVPPTSPDAAADDAGAPADGGWTRHAILAVLVVIAILLAVLVLRRGRAGTGAALALAVGLLLAGPAVPPATAAEDDDGDRREAPQDPRLDVPKAWDGKPDPDWEPNDPGAKPGDVGDGGRDKDKDKGKPGGDAPPAPAEGDYKDRIAALESHVRELHERTARDRAEIERLRLLAEEDREQAPDPGRLPPMPLSCRPPDALETDRVRDAKREEQWADYDACQRCYAKPLEDLDRQLELYERLRILYGGAKADLARMVAAGDMAPKPHYMVDSAWQAQKQKITVAFKGTQDAYDAKHAEFRDRLSAIVDALGACEAEHNNNPLWRDTSGRLFLESISSSYRRND